MCIYLYIHIYTVYIHRHIYIYTVYIYNMVYVYIYLMLYICLYVYIYLYIQISLNHNSVWINCLHFIQFQIFFCDSGVCCRFQTQWEVFVNEVTTTFFPFSPPLTPYSASCLNVFAVFLLLLPFMLRSSFALTDRTLPNRERRRGITIPSLPVNPSEHVQETFTAPCLLMNTVARAEFN